jgi:hypothetical protein
MMPVRFVVQKLMEHRLGYIIARVYYSQKSFKSGSMNRKHQRLLLFFSIAGFIALTNSSCQKNNGGSGGGGANGGGGGNGGGINITPDSAFVTGNGIAASQTRTPGNFTAVKLTNAGKVNITSGPTLQLTVADDSNLLALVQTTVTNNELSIGYKPNVSIIGGNLIVTIVMPALDSTTNSGSGSFNVNGNFITNGVLKTSISGSGGITLTGGSADSLIVNITGSGNVKAEAFPVKDAIVTISGSGEADVAPSDLLNALLSGSGSVHYTGNPTITQKITGSGTVIKD